jgi:hypothetical protein
MFLFIELRATLTFVATALWEGGVRGLSDVFFIIIIIHLFTCAYIVWVISPPCLPLPPLMFS